MTQSVTRDVLGADELAEGVPLRKYKRVIGLCSLATFLDGYDVQALGLAVPGMAADFAVPPTAFAIALSASLAGMALGAVSLGPLADKFGRRTMLIAMMVIVGISMLGALSSTSPLSLALWRTVTGLGIGGSVPIAIAMTSEFAPARLRTALVTAMVVCTALGSFAAGIVAPWLEAELGWHGIFAVGGALPLTAALLFWIWLPESFRVRDQSTGQVTRASVATLVRPPLRRRTLLLWMIFWSNLFVNYSLISWLPTLLSAAGWEKSTAQRATGLLALGGIVGGLALAWLADKGLAFRSLLITYVLVAVVLCLFVLAPPSTSGWLTLIGLVGAGAFGAQMALGSYCAGFYPAPIRTTGLGWAAGIGRVGSMIGPAVLAALMSAHFASPAILGMLMVPMVVCAICVVLLPGALKDGA